MRDCSFESKTWYSHETQYNIVATLSTLHSPILLHAYQLLALSARLLQDYVTTTRSIVRAVAGNLAAVPTHYGQSCAHPSPPLQRFQCGMMDSQLEYPLTVSDRRTEAHGWEPTISASYLEASGGRVDAGIDYQRLVAQTTSRYLFVRIVTTVSCYTSTGGRDLVCKVAGVR